MNEILFWILFNFFIAAMLALDLGIFHRRARRPSLKQSLAWSAIWIVLAGLFAIVLNIWQGHSAALEFSTGYVIELSLSADNLFIFLVIFKYFRLPDEQQYRVLFWGIIGAIVMRAAFIFAGVGLIRRFHFVIYLFGALLIVSGIRLLLPRGAQLIPEKNGAVRLARRFLRFTPEFVASRFFVRENGGLRATPLLLVLLVIETTDVIFAVDSIPAVLAITLNAFIVYTSNIFAILGLRSMFFALSSLLAKFAYLHYGISCVLVFVGIKMLCSRRYPISTQTSLAIIGAILVSTIGASLLHGKAVGPRLSSKGSERL